MPFYADTHAHIYLSEFEADMDELIGRAERASVLKVALPNIDSSAIDSLKRVADLNYNFHPMMGLHPCYVKPETWKEELERVRQELDSNYTTIHGRPYCAVGEIGIDLYWDTTTQSIQTEAFEQQMLWAHERQLAVVVHCRNAYDEVIASIGNMGAQRPKGVLHCFTGTMPQAEALIDLGFLLGIGGVVTYKNSPLAEVVKQIDLKHMVLETDSPYLPPVPHRGKRNEPAYTALVAEKIAELKGLTDPLLHVGQPTSANAAQLFNW
jgi:TatD DNase family protein